jgi:hypothetical protein
MQSELGRHSLGTSILLAEIYIRYGFGLSLVGDVGPGCVDVDTGEPNLLLNELTNKTSSINHEQPAAHLDANVAYFGLEASCFNGRG